MSIVILDAMEGENKISSNLKEKLMETDKGIICFELKNMSILPCRSCGACSFKSPGKCVFQDDSHEMLRAIAKCSTLIMLTPIRFGGYTSTLKKAVDKFMSLALPLYMVRHGHLLHPARYGSKFIVGIGVYEGNSKDQEDCFRRLVENNALNMQCEYRTLILQSSDDAEKVKQEVSSLQKEMC